MKKMLNIIVMVLLALLFLPATSAFAQTPKVPITYEGDTAETIARRVRWIEEAKKEGKLMWWGSMAPNLKQELIAEFNKIYFFIKVDHWRGGSMELATKIETEYASDLHTVDIILGGGPHNYPRWRKIGIIEKFTDFIPGIKKIPPEFHGSHGDWFDPGSNAVTPQYNTNLVSEHEAPTNWEDLLNPKWKGQIGITRDVKIWTALALADGGWGIEKTEKFLRNLAKQDLVWARGHSAGHTLLIAGEYKLFAEEYLYHTFNSRKKGAPVNWSRVSPVPIIGSYFTLYKKGPHPNAARLFLEWQCSPQGLVTYEEIVGKGSPAPGSGTRTSKALEGLKIVYRTEDTILKANELGLMERFSKALGIIK